MPLVESLLVVAGRSFLNAITPELKKKFEAFLQKTDWYTASGRYYDKIEKTYGWTRILGKPDPIKLEAIFTDVYLLDKITALQRFDIYQLEYDLKTSKEKQKRLSGLDLVKAGELNRLYILGKPGAGKTTFLKYLALKASNNEIKKIPIFVSLKEWADSGDNLMDFLVKQFDICNFPDSKPLVEYILETGQAIVLFDGLDETQQEDGKRDKTIDEIRDFSRKYDTSQILVTCRIAATDYTFEEFNYLEVADFTPEQVTRYVENYFKVENHFNVENYYDNEYLGKLWKFREEYSDKLWKFKDEFAKPENNRLQEMASTPLLLSLLCLNFDETETFPTRRVEIYEEGINALLHKWDSSRSIKRDDIYKGLSIGRKRQMFARIAAQTFEKKEYFIPKRKLAGMIVDYLSQLPDAPPIVDIDGDVILRAIEAQHSILVERAKDIYSFSHLTFQEYFTAKYIVDNSAKGTINKLLSQENIVDNRWREVIFTTCSLLDEADIFCEIFLENLNNIINSNVKLKNFIDGIRQKVIFTTGENFAVLRMLYCAIELNLVSAVSFVHKNDQYFVNDLIQKIFRFKANSDDIFTRIYCETLTSSLNDDFAKISNLSSTKNFYINKPVYFPKEFTQIEFDIIISTFYSTAQFIKQNYTTSKFLVSKFITSWREFLKTSDTKLTKGLIELKIPPFELGIYNWEKFTKYFKDILVRDFFMGREWNFFDEEYLQLDNYIEGYLILLDCLKLAAISNRQVIEDSFLSPPNI